ncbi:DUF2842 domain-containing protein [Pararhodobacter sp. SW119]|uniref:DUF2842 domain-containing protein n=1 Tax=Pararhodobacter sp. SW119 TaxID=2780075 RepID=UPI001AE01538|nr:DUF2842 domain-containing protein [Pararhodobacter sp. SW119]
MTLSHKTRKRLSLLILVIALPLYIVVVVNILALFDRPPFWVELGIYILLGIIWALPLKAVFRGVGQPDPDAVEHDNARGR